MSDERILFDANPLALKDIADIADILKINANPQAVIGIALRLAAEKLKAIEK